MFNWLLDRLFSIEDVQAAVEEDKNWAPFSAECYMAIQDYHK